MVLVKEQKKRNESYHQSTDGINVDETGTLAVRKNGNEIDCICL